MSTGIMKKIKQVKKPVWLSFSLLLCMLVFFAWKSRNKEQVVKEENIILHVAHLNPVFDSLRLLEKDSSRTFNVLHIGDSHVQGNYFTDKIRSLMYADFGLGSKGLAFPFQVAKTNTMAEIRSSSQQTWEARRNTQALFTTQLGVTGRAIVNTVPNASFKIRIPAMYSDYHFNEATVFYTPITKSCKLVLKDSSQNILMKVSSIKEKGFICESFSHKNAIHQVTLQLSQPGNFIFHGLILRNSKRGGITYHVAGVNGSQYRNWSASNILAKQSAYLKPDLIIISLGTNDANDLALTTDEFTKQVHDLVSSLKKENPGACFILTTPPDSWYKKRYVNKQVDRIRHAILLYAEEHHIACWDLYAAMGGENSIVTWNKQGLAASDLVHFSKAGYELHGELFYESFIKHYTSYVSDRPE